MSLIQNGILKQSTKSVARLGALVIFCIQSVGLVYADDSSKIGPNLPVITADQQCTMLSDYSQNTPGAPRPLQFLDPAKAREMQQRYDDMVRSYELKQNYGLNSAADEQSHSDDVHAFSHYVYGNLRDYQSQTNGQRIQANVESDPNLSQAEKPVTFVGAGVSMYTGNPMKLKVTDDTKVQAITNVPHQNGQVAVLSPYVNAAVLVDLNGTDPNTGITPERYRLNMSRSLDVWDLSSGVSYLGTSACVDTNLTKAFTKNLSASVDRYQQVYQYRGPNNATISFNYGIHF